MTRCCRCARPGRPGSSLVVLALLALTMLLGSSAHAQDQVWVVNFPDQQTVSGDVRISEPVPVSRIQRFEDVVVTAVSRQQTSQLVLAGTLETAGFSTVVLSLAAEIQGTVPRTAEIGVILVPEEDVALRALKDGYLLFPIEVTAKVPAEAPPYVASTPEKHELAFPRYRVYLYNSGKRTARVQVFALLRS